MSPGGPGGPGGPVYTTHSMVDSIEMMRVLLLALFSSEKRFGHYYILQGLDETLWFHSDYFDCVGI